MIEIWITCSQANVLACGRAHRYQSKKFLSDRDCMKETRKLLQNRSSVRKVERTLANSSICSALCIMHASTQKFYSICNNLHYTRKLFYPFSIIIFCLLHIIQAIQPQLRISSFRWQQEGIASNIHSPR